MESKRPHSLNRVLSIGCFILGFIFAAPAVWLCVRGEIPPIPLDDTTAVLIEGTRIYDLPVGRWAYPVIVTGLFLTAAALCFAGWRALRVKKSELT